MFQKPFTYFKIVYPKFKIAIQPILLILQILQILLIRGKYFKTLLNFDGCFYAEDCGLKAADYPTFVG
jgi:hypothetical protein